MSYFDHDFMPSLSVGFEELKDPTSERKNNDVQIHPSALVARSAKLEAGVSIGPHAMVGPQVTLRKGVKIGANALIEGHTEIGAGTIVFPFASVGSVPQDLKFHGEDAQLLIGEKNRIREYVNISIGTSGGGGVTRIGDRNLFMVYTHIGHDSLIGNDCIFANAVQIAGHVEIGNGVVFGGMSGAHQFSHYGDLAMIAAGSMCSQDVPPFCMVHGDHARINGLNVVGLRRHGPQKLSDIKAMYRLLYSEGLSVEDAMARITADVNPTAERETFLDFLRKSKRGVCR